MVIPFLGGPPARSFGFGFTSLQAVAHALPFTVMVSPRVTVVADDVSDGAAQAALAGSAVKAISPEKAVTPVSVNTKQATKSDLRSSRDVAIWTG